MEPNDWLVAVSETRLSDHDTVIELPVEHAFMMAHAVVRTAVARALATATD